MLDEYDYEVLYNDYNKLMDFLESFTDPIEVEELLLDAEDTDAYAMLLSNRIYKKLIGE